MDLTKVSIDTIYKIMVRPSHKEINRKIVAAKKAVSKDHIFLVNQEIIAIDALEMGYLIEDLPSILLELLENTRPKDYMGSKPPQKSYESKILDMELFAFRIPCDHFNGQVYYKFAINENGVYLVSLHKHREKGGAL